MLGRLGFELASGFQIGKQSQVQNHAATFPQFESKLANGFNVRQGFDVAHRTTDFGDDHLKVFAFAQEQNSVFDFVGDMRNDLNGFAEIIPATFLVNDGLVDTAGGDVVGLAGFDVQEAFVVTKV